MVSFTTQVRLWTPERRAAAGGRCRCDRQLWRTPAWTRADTLQRGRVERGRGGNLSKPFDQKGW